MSDNQKSTILFGMLLCAFAIHALYLGGIAEDAFISFRYAKHLANGSGLIWNPGEPPIEGYTNFLWVVMCAAAVRLGLDLLLFAQIAGLCAALLAMFYTCIFARDILGAGAFTALVAPLMLAVSGPFAAWAGSGMETGLFTLLLIAGIYHAARYRTALLRRDLYRAALLLFLATLTRPEGALAFAVVIGWTALYPGPDRTPRSCIRPAALYAVFFLGYTIWRYNYFGMLLPNTFYAKTGGGWHQYARGGIYSLFFALYFIAPLAPALAMSRRSIFGSRRTRERTGRRFGAVLCAAVGGWYALYIIAVGGDYMAMYRFFVPLLPLIYLIFGCAVLELARISRHRMPIAALAFAVLATAVQSTPLERALFYKPPRQHGTWRGVQTERWHVARLSLIGGFFGTCAAGSGESIATPAIGAISYYSGLNVYGFFGVTDRHIARQTVKTPGSTIGWPGHEKEDFEYLFSKKPTYVLFSRALTTEPLPFPTRSQFSLAAQLGGNGPSAANRGDPRLDGFMREHYDRMAVWLVDKKNQEAGYLTFLELKQRYRERAGALRE